MPDGELRRPPQLWEQRLARTTSVLAAGVSSGDATAIVTPTPPPGSDSGVEPAPVLPPPGDFIAPSQPTLIGSVQGINVVWNGLNSAGDLWPSDTSYVEVHMDTSGPTFTCGTATLKGRLARPGGLAVTGLSAGTTYYFRLRGADPAGNLTDPSTAASGQPGLINAPDIAANAITANSIVAGTITGWSINSAYLSGGTVSGGYITGGTISGGYISGGTISGGYITGGTVDGGFITGGTVSGATVQSSSSSNKVVLSSGNQIDFYASSSVKARLYTSGNDLLIDSADDFVFGNTGNSNSGTDFVKFIDKGGATGHRLTIGDSDDPDAIYLDTGEIRMRAVYDQTSANAANVRIGSDTVDYRLARSTSTVRVKDELITVGDNLTGVPANKLAEFGASVDPYDVLTVSPTEFQSLCEFDEGARVFGFIAEDVAVKFPWAAEWNDNGEPLSVADRPIVAALLAIVRDQQSIITDLRARIEALEA